MIQEAIERFDKKREQIRAQLSTKHPKGYKEIVQMVIEAVASDEGAYGEFNPDPTKIHMIDDGDYQGTLLFIIPQREYQPSKYYRVFVGYGSCSGCDTLESIKDYDDDPPKKEQVDAYMQLCLHIVQKLKVLGEAWREE